MPNNSPTPDKKINRIAIVYAMRGEARPLIDHADLQPIEPFDSDLPMLYYQGQVGSASVLLSVNGVDSRYPVDQIGTNAATLSAYLVLQHFKPDLLINPGTAGGVRAHGAGIGDVYVGQDNVHLHDRRLPVAKYKEYAVGGYPTLKLGRIISELGLKAGAVSTGNSFGCNEAELKSLIDARTNLVEMEAAAIAWAAWEKKVPFIPVKGITDLIDVDHSLEHQFNTNFRDVSGRVAEKVFELISRMGGKTLGELGE